MVVFGKETHLYQKTTIQCSSALWNGSRILFLGDLERKGEAWLLAHHSINADVVKVGHHGSRTSSSKTLVDSVVADHAIMSLGFENRFHFPDISVMNRWENAGAQIWRTDLLGTVEIKIGDDGEIVSSYTY